MRIEVEAHMALLPEKLQLGQARRLLACQRRDLLAMLHKAWI
jgi:hypothetical protein